MFCLVVGVVLMCLRLVYLVCLDLVLRLFCWVVSDCMGFN